MLHSNTYTTSATAVSQYPLIIFARIINLKPQGEIGRITWRAIYTFGAELAAGVAYINNHLHGGASPKVLGVPPKVWKFNDLNGRSAVELLDLVWYFPRFLVVALARLTPIHPRILPIFSRHRTIINHQLQSRTPRLPPI